MAIDRSSTPTQDPTQSSQESTQSTQEISYTAPAPNSGSIWGALIPWNPLNPGAYRVAFDKSTPSYTIGRSRKEDVDVHFPAATAISRVHCCIKWDEARSAIIVQDLESRAGTYINGEIIPPGECRLLKDWNHISFGPPPDDPKARPKDDYRFVFRYMAHERYGLKGGIDDLYDVHYAIGEGAYATVVKALQRREIRWYAVKRFRAEKLRQMKDRGEDAHTMNHLQKEIQVLQRLEHPNICKLKEAFYEGDSISIVLELCEGGDLMRYMCQGEVKSLFELEAQQFTYQICDALAYMHGMGVVHRDLKPENVLLTSDRPPFVKVSDFGLAGIFNSESMLKTPCGTRAFAAPEVLVHGADKTYDKVVDSWSLGVMVYMMLTAEDPFQPDRSFHNPNWELLAEYNIVGDAHGFLEALLEFRPYVRMTPKDALAHPWIADQREKLRTRRLERESSLRLAASSAKAKARARRKKPAETSAKEKAKSKCKLSRTSSATRIVDPLKEEPTGGKREGKRKASEMRRGGSLSSLSVNEDLPPPRKRARGELTRSKSKRGDVDRLGELPPLPSTSEAPSRGWPVPDVDPDEVPGLGRVWSEFP